MEVNYFDLSGGINQASTKTELGLSPKTVYWSDSKNVEIYNSKGIIKQKGNTIMLELPEKEEVTGMKEMEADGVYKLVIATISGKIYVYSAYDDSLTLVNKTLTGKRVLLTAFLRGMLVSTESDAMFYIKNNGNYDVVECNVNDRGGKTLYPECITVYKGRICCAKESTIYYSALGSYNDFTTENDAGYINDFHTDTADITAMSTYKDYLAVYKRERVYLLTGSNPSDFAITLFADKGTMAKGSVINVDNKQYFLSNGIFALEQVGELNQIRLGSEISINIREEFDKFDRSRMKDSFVVHYQEQNKLLFFFPYMDDPYYKTIWINDYVNRAWYKRVVPQKVVTACIFNSYVLTADDKGNIYREFFGNTFNEEPIEFMWKSPFLSLGNVLHRKIIDEFYFVLDDAYDNKFHFSLYKDYDNEYCDDKELIYERHYTHFLWAPDDEDAEDNDNPQYCWGTDDSEVPVWPIASSAMEKAEICGSNYSVQICVDGSDISDNCAIIGLQFREIYNDD
ncbi:MAG: hypothetical protein NC191_05470 [Muribaculaceae bacterium]|nr:hypothetical protein [Muribaculaceae bacterium]